MKNVASFLLIFCLLLIHHWYSAPNYSQISTPAVQAIPKYLSLITDFQLIAQYFNLVDINGGQVNIFIMNCCKKNQRLLVSDHQEIIDQTKTLSLLSPIKKQLYSYKTEMTARNKVVFAKTISLKMISPTFDLDPK